MAKKFVNPVEKARKRAKKNEVKKVRSRETVSGLADPNFSIF